MSASGLAAINFPATAGATTTFKATHGAGLCNLAIFLAHKRRTAEQFGVHLEFVNAPSTADVATIFGSGQVDISSIPYTNFFTLVDKGAPVKIVAGTGVEGCIIVAKPGIDTAQKLKGKTLATFQADTLEVLPYDWLKKNGVDWNEVDVRFMGSSPELAQAFISGAVDAICHIEPYATQALDAVEGAVMLSDGTDIYKPYYTDCVIAASDRAINENREALKGLLKAMLISQYESEKDRVSALKDTVGTYYKTDFDTIMNAATSQFLMIDQRQNEKFMIDRSQSVAELGYIKKPVDSSVFDWSLLEEVVAENPNLYRRLVVV
ncbi:MAG: ABC transporter substrate-binding protein [Gammaproteobacteria bacterium]|nr:ABC transporter substrate-binding protein [Gammaproteobacteria bacterium]